MDAELEARMLERFGPQGLVRPEGLEVSLPEQVGPYFTAAEAARAEELGSDRGGRLHLGEGGAVRNDLSRIQMPDQYVNASPAAFAAGLLALDRAVPAITTATSTPAAFSAYRELRETLLRVDESAFAARESWWPRVLDDLRLPLNVGTSAAVEFTGSDGEKKILTAISGPGRPHPEELLWHQLRAAEVPLAAVTRVYCELEPCLMPGHYCAAWLAGEFPEAAFTHSFGYGESADEREAGVEGLMRYLAEQR
jgi:hypothetical protein